MQSRTSKYGIQPDRDHLELIKILAVKATEENSKKILKPMAVSSANISAIGAKNDFDFIKKRAVYLFKLLPSSLKLVATMNKFPANWVKLTVLISIVIGMLSNYLGPSQIIHAVYNPLSILLVWNLLIYLFMVLKRFWKIRMPKSNIQAQEIIPDLQTENIDMAPKSKGASGFLLNWVIGGVYKGVIQLRAKFIDNSTKVTVMQKILPEFWQSYTRIAGTTLILRFKSLMNIGAASLLLGALIGIYFRGLFFKYNIIWQSTFVSEPETIQNMLNSLYGLASYLLNGNWINEQMVDQLLLVGGTTAGPWIHMMALTTLLFIFIPRILLYFYYLKRSKKSTENIDINEEYYQETILKNRESLVEIIRDGIHEIVSKKINKIGRTISEFVINDYYEAIIEPILVSFREKGGKIKTLELRLYDSQESFEPILLNYLKDIQEDFRDSILNEINLFLGRKLDLDINTASTYQPQSDEIDQRISGKIAADIGDTIGGTIVTTVALAAGSIGGGVGKSLGIAIISGLLGVSGPLGLLIGGLITAITLGGFYKLKRNQISSMVKDVPFPAFVIAMTLTDAKIEKGRKDTYEHTEKEIKKMLKPKINEITDSILQDITY